MKKIIGIIAIIIGLIFLAGGLYTIVDNIIIRIRENRLEYILGIVLGAGFVAILGFFLVIYGYKKIAKNKTY